jgi:hypothetical protein
MSTLSVVRKGLTAPAPMLIDPSGYRGISSANSFWFFDGPGGYDYQFSYSNLHSSLTAFKKCPPLFSIILKKTQAYSNGKTFIVNKKGKAKEKESTNPIAQKIRDLMGKPNPFQSEKEFKAQLYYYCQLYGFSILLPIVPTGFQNYEATKLWNLPLHLLNIEETKKNWTLAYQNSDVIKSIVLDFGEERVFIPVNSVWIFKDFTPNIDSPVFPISRVVGNEAPINNIIGAYETRGRIIEDRGAQGIISSDSKDSSGYIPIKEEEKNQMHDEFRARYGLKKNQYQYIITSASVKWTQIVQNTKELMLFEEIEDDIMRLCDSWCYPYPLMASARTNNLGGSNTDPNKRALYQDTIIPEAENLAEQWSNFFGLYALSLQWQDDYGHIPCMQDDEQKRALARKTRNEAMQIEFLHNLCTMDQWRVANGDDPIGGEFGGKYYYELVQMGWKFGSTGATLSLNQGDQNSGANGNGSSNGNGNGNGGDNQSNNQ